MLLVYQPRHTRKFYVSIAFKVLNIIKIDAFISDTVKNYRDEGVGEIISLRRECVFNHPLLPVLWVCCECCAVGDFRQFTVRWQYGFAQ